MTETEKKDQVEAAASVAAAADIQNDLDLMTPEPIVFTLGDRKYNLLPLKVKEMRLLVQLSEIKVIGQNAEQLDKVMSIVGQLLHEDDKDFLESNLDMNILTRLFKIIQQLTYGPIPKGKTTSGN